MNKENAKLRTHRTFTCVQIGVVKTRDALLEAHFCHPSFTNMFSSPSFRFPCADGLVSAWARSRDYTPSFRGSQTDATDFPDVLVEHIGVEADLSAHHVDSLWIDIHFSRPT
jgi:hypothetical protein